ncbi:putative transmembrane protein [Senna tora]|uniref:Putative transmembrane protein n=1 Tax=Senna tora TaxID=362788 RepID=A0A834WHK5_9FABA|nr:putative transmembrane protein [Senna tora]
MKGRLNMEVMKIREYEREAKETEHEEDTIHTIVFTAGTVLLMVCLKRFLVEQWRAWVFLILNLILLAILFMSMRPRSSANEGIVEEVKNDKTKMKKRASECSQEIEERKKDCCYKEQCWTSEFQNEGDEKEEEEVEVEEAVPRLSKEELNERVEAFITMFRQHLVSDARQAENFRFQKNSNMTPKGLKCLIVEA